MISKTRGFRNNPDKKFRNNPDKKFRNNPDKKFRITDSGKLADVATHPNKVKGKPFGRKRK